MPAPLTPRFEELGTTSPAANPTAVATHLESVDPATGEVIARFELTLPAEVPRILESARAAQSAWSERALGARCALLARLRDVLYQRRREIAEVVTRETGKPLVESLFADVLVSLDTADYYARRRSLRRMGLRPVRVPHHNLVVKAKSGRLRYEPFGVIGIISPWNYPLAIPFGQIVPAVAAGNAVILKSSELTPWCGALVEELFHQAGFPAGVVQVIHGSGEVGAALVDAAPDKLIFTGSVATGRRVAQACAERLIPCVLELGGKDAMIVLGDADLEVAASAAVWGSFTNCGQSCISVERIYVERPVRDPFTELCVAKTRQLRLGPGLDPETEVGPMIRAFQVDRVEQQLHDAVARGARTVAGGRRRPELGPCFFEPTVVADVDDSMLLMTEETFGPVLALRSVRDADEALRLANDSRFALGASIWTRDTRRARQLAARLKAGAVMINDVASYFGVCEAPHGGRGWSGWGRTHSWVGLLELLQVKYIDVDWLPRWPKSWWYGYNQELSIAADSFMEFLFAPSWRRRWRNARGALRGFFRSHRI
jgi:succinate-semialdehyde dehydrogenase/glutarate-semialdehyde dehydrogenase